MPRLRAMSQGRQQDLTNKALADRKRIHKQGKQTRYNKVRSVFGFVFFSSPGSNKCIMISVYSGPLLFLFREWADSKSRDSYWRSRGGM